MSAPTFMLEFTDRFFRNNRVEGDGIETTTCIPCPFCAAPDWMCPKILEVEEVITREAMCSQCGRSAKSIITRDGGETRVELVQTGGADQPEWMHPRIRRVDDDGSAGGAS